MIRTNKFKLSLAKRHVDNLETLRSISEDTGIEMGRIKYLCALYRKYGEEIFSQRENYVYTREFKLSAISKALASDRAYMQTSLEIGIFDPSILRDWVKLFFGKGRSRNSGFSGQGLL